MDKGKKQKAVYEFTYEEQTQNLNYFDAAVRLLGLNDLERSLAERLLDGPVCIRELPEMLKEAGKEGPDGLSPVFGHSEDKVWLYPVFAAYVQGILPQPETGTLPEGVHLEFPEKERLYGRESVVDEIAGVLGSREERERPLCVVLTENGQEDADFVAGQTACRLGMPLLYWDGRQVCFQELLLTMLLYDALLCLDLRETDVSVGEIQQKKWLIMQTGWRVSRFFVMTQKKDALKMPSGVDCLYREIPAAGKNDRIDFLKDFMQEKGLLLDKQQQAALAGGVYSMSAFRQLLTELLTEQELLGEEKKKAPLPEHVVERTLARYGEKNTALFGIRLLASDRTLKELCLPRRQEEELAEICAMLRQREKVLKEWGFGEKYSYGNGTSLLFYGAPGTGKTMAAQAVAGELSMALYRVDLSQLISKYVGETQKNIGRIFEQARRLEGILFFDEADALFSKRNEVSDAQDKYSNAETAYLLQCMEEWDGICILATNLLHNFDEAFRRRITYMLNFPMPDAELRKKLWKHVFPQQAVLLAEVDMEILAENFELSGAAIRNAALQGAYLAAAKGEDIGMCHILSGIANEYRKLNRSMKPEQRGLLDKWEVSRADYSKG